MKKFYAIPMLAAMCFASCSQDDVVNDASHAGLQAINFSAPVVNKTTRGEITQKSEIGAFDVWGYQDSTSPGIFNGTEVTVGSDADLTCTYSSDDTQYWVDGSTYKFSAICWGGTPDANKGTVNMIASTGVTTISNYVSDGNSDLMYAYTVTEHSECTDGKVPLTFQHQLAKIKFTFTNTSSVAVKIQDVKISGVKNKGTVTLAQSTTTAVTPTWSSLSGSEDVAFNLVADADGSTSSLSTDNATLTVNASGVGYAGPKFFIPVALTGTDRYTVTFTAVIGSTTEKFEKYLDEVTLQGGYAYNLAVTLGYDAINFKVEDLTEYTTGTATMSTEQALLTKDLRVKELFDNMMQYNVKKFTLSDDNSTITGIESVYTSLDEELDAWSSRVGSTVSADEAEYVTYTMLEASDLCNPNYNSSTVSAGIKTRAASTNYNNYKTLSYDGNDYRLPTAAELHLLLPYWNVINTSDNVQYPVWSRSSYTPFAESNTYDRLDDNNTSVHADCADYHIVRDNLTGVAANTEIAGTGTNKVAYAIRFKGTKDCAAYRWSYEGASGKKCLRIMIKGLHLDDGNMPASYETITDVAKEEFWTDSEITFVFPASGYYDINGDFCNGGHYGCAWSASRTDTSSKHASGMYFGSTDAGVNHYLVGHRRPVRLVRVV